MTFGICVCLYSVYGKTFWLVVETFAELFSCVLDISPFFAILYIFCVTRGHVMPALARRFRQILRVRSKFDISKSFRENFVLVKMAYTIYVRVYEIKIRSFFRIDSMLADKI